MAWCSHSRPIRAAVLVVIASACSQAWAAGGHGHGGHAGHSGQAAHAGRAGNSGAAVHAGRADGRSSFAQRGAPGPRWHGSGAAHAPHALRNGHWFHGVRGGQFGWWWMAAAPAYVYLQPGYAVTSPYFPGDVVPGDMAVEPVYGYYCNSLQRFYPEVPTCPEPWTMVVPAPE